VDSKGDLSLVRASLVTGRTHQIRATLCSLGFHVVGDKLYGLDEGFFLRFVEGTLSGDDRKRLRLDHQALHAERLEFTDRNGELVELESPPRFGL
jgi:23S rRNA-/tRNA-specific pseudouridylate synthase